MRWSGNTAEFADGTPGAHTVHYTPGRWAQITPWPSALASTSHVGDAGISRAQVASIVADALRREAFREALVATYVWGKGKRGSRSGSGPASLQKILTAEGLDTALARAVTTLSERSAAAAYAGLQDLVPGFGPSFYTKFLYFAGKTVPPATGPQPLSSTGSWPGVCDPWPRRSAGRPATTPTARSPAGSGGTGTGHRTATRSTSPSCRRPPAKQRQRVPGRPTPRPTCSNTPCSAPRGHEPVAACDRGALRPLASRARQVHRATSGPCGPGASIGAGLGRASGCLAQ